jgi:hypothetical protein
MNNVLSTTDLNQIIIPGNKNYYFPCMRSSPFVQENGWNNTVTGGGVNAITRATHGGQGISSHQTDSQIQNAWGKKMANELYKGNAEKKVISGK